MLKRLSGNLKILEILKTKWILTKKPSNFKLKMSDVTPPKQMKMDNDQPNSTPIEADRINVQPENVDVAGPSNLDRSEQRESVEAARHEADIGWDYIYFKRIKIS